MTDIRKCLEQHELDKYGDAFEENEISVSDLHLLSDDDLRELGLPMGPRKRLLATVGETAPSADTVAQERTPHPDSTLPSGEAERRQLTVMFCDLVGSTELTQTLDARAFDCR